MSTRPPLLLFLMLFGTSCVEVILMVFRRCLNIRSVTKYIDAMEFVQSNSHPILWKLVAESALDQLDLDVADKAYVLCEDYQELD